MPLEKKTNHPDQGHGSGPGSLNASVRSLDARTRGFAEHCRESHGSAESQANGVTAGTHVAADERLISGLQPSIVQPAD